MAFRRRRDLAERFWEKVDQGPDCWEWIAGKNNKGYGLISVGHSEQRLAHRVSYEFAFGDIDDGLCVCHSCDHPDCVRPDHLFLGTQRENLEDMYAKRRDGVTKLKPAQVREVRSLVDDGWKLRDIAAAYGVGHSAVWKIGKRITHKAVA